MYINAIDGKILQSAAIVLQTQPSCQLNFVG